MTIDSTMIPTGVERSRVVAVQPQRDVDDREHGDRHHDRGVRVRGPPRLRAGSDDRSQSNNPVTAASTDTIGASDEHVRAGVPELRAPRAVVAADDRDHVERRGENVRGDREVGQRRVKGLARPPSHVLELSPAQA